MIDTIRSGFDFYIPPEDLPYLFFEYGKIGDKYKFVKYSKVIQDWDGRKIQVVYYPQDIHGNPNSLLLLEMSLPKILFGNNIEMLKDKEDILESIFIVNKVLKRESIFSGIQFQDGIIHRIDLCYNHYVEDRVGEFITALSSLEHPKRQTVAYKHQGVQYQAIDISTKFYNKELESKSDLAYGILRQETTLRDRDDFQKYFGNKYPTLELITKDSIFKILHNDLQKLHLEDTIIGSKNLASEKLIRYYGKTIGDRLTGYLLRSQFRSPKEMHEEYNQSRSTHNRNLKMIRDAGVSLVLIHSYLPLPPLEISL